MRAKPKRHLPPDQESTMERKKQAEKAESSKKMSSIGEDQVDLAQTYTGLDKKISEEFISIAMDPERKSKASSSHGSEIGTSKTSWKRGNRDSLMNSCCACSEEFSYVFSTIEKER